MHARVAWPHSTSRQARQGRLSPPCGSGGYTPESDLTFGDNQQLGWARPAVSLKVNTQRLSDSVMPTRLTTAPSPLNTSQRNKQRHSLFPSSGERGIGICVSQPPKHHGTLIKKVI